MSRIAARWAGSACGRFSTDKTRLTHKSPVTWAVTHTLVTDAVVLPAHMYKTTMGGLYHTGQGVFPVQHWQAWHYGNGGGGFSYNCLPSRLGKPEVNCLRKGLPVHAMQQ